MSLLGSTNICHCRTSPPNTLTSATPGTAIMCGLMVQSTMVRSSIRLRLLELMPMPNTVLALDANGVMLGMMFFGNWLFRVASRSATA